MDLADYSATRARLRSELDAARLQHDESEEILDLARELVELALDHAFIDDARTALGDVESALDPADPGGPMLLDYYRARIAEAAEDGPAAVEAAERALAVARENDFAHDLPHMLDALARGHLLSGQKAKALAEREEAAQAFEDGEQHFLAGLAWAWLAEQGPAEAAQRRFERALDMSKQSGDLRLEVSVLFRRGAWHAERNEYLAARHALQRGIDLAREEADDDGLANCLEQLAWLETEAFNHQEAIRVASLALAAARDDWQRARALDARANARHRLHEHRAARADLLRAAEAYARADNNEWAKDARRRADGDRVLHLLHHLPTWVFRDRDMSTREAAFRKRFQPLFWWVIGTTFVWPLVVLGLAPLAPKGAVRTCLALLAFAPMFLSGVLIGVGVVVTKRNDRRDGAG